MSDSRSLKVLAGALLLVGATALNASAQITTGQVSGTVTDSTGGVIPGVTVLLTSESQGTKVGPTVTNEQGIYRFPNVTADSYTLDATLSGFKPVKRTGIKVSGGDRVAIQALTLDAGGMTDQVEVKAEAPLIQAASGERSFAVQTQDVANLPTANGIRGFTSVLQLVPGISGTNRLGGGGEDNYMMDGVSIMDTGNNGLMGGMNVPVDAIAEVKVLTSGYQAEYGRSSGLQVSAVTKSGTNRFHGSIYDVERNSDWNANSWVNIQNLRLKTVSKQRDWGYTIGGPVGKPGGNNKLFFFYAQEFNPRTANAGTVNYRVPTQAERNGDFSQTLDNNGALFNTIFNVNNPGGLARATSCSTTVTTGCYADGGVVGKIPQALLYGPGMAALNLYPLPSLTQATGTNFNYISQTPVRKTLSLAPNARVDYQLNSRFRISGKVSAQRDPTQSAPGNLPGYTDTLMKFPWAVNISSTVNFTLTPTTFLEATYGGVENQLGTPNVSFFSNRDNDVCPAALSAQVANCSLGSLPFLFPDAGVMNHDYYEYTALQKVGTPFLVGDRIMLPPNMTWGSRIGSQPPNFGFPGFMNINKVQDLSVSVTKVAGRHTFKTGLYVNHSYKAQNQGGGNFQGVLDFSNNTSNPNDSGFGFANAALGLFNTYTQTSKFVEGHFIYNSVESYLQDNWKLNRRLTLDYGLRVVHQGPQYDSLKQVANFFPDQWSLSQAPLLYTATCATTFPCANDRRALDPTTNTVLGAGSSSLIGQAVLGNGKTDNGLLLAGNGIADTGYVWPYLVFAPRFGVAYDLDGSQRYVFRGSVGLFYDRPDGNTVFPTVANPPNASSTTYQWGSLQSLSTTKLGSGAVPTINAFQYNAQVPSDIQFNGGLQMVLPWSSSLDVEYVGHHQYNALAQVDLNTIDLGTTLAASGLDPTQSTPTAKPDNLLRAMRGFGSVNVRESQFVRTYHSLQTSFNRRFRSGVSFGGSWTWAFRDFGNVGTVGGNPQIRINHNADGTFYTRDDNATALAKFGDQGPTKHIIKLNFVWDLPDINGGGMIVRAIAQVVNDWQLSGIYSIDSGSPYDIGFSYNTGATGQQLTGSSSYSARVVIPDVSAIGNGCSSNQYSQFNNTMIPSAVGAVSPVTTTVFAGPQVGSVGLDSGRNLLHGCGNHTLDLAIARNIRLGGGRTIQLRADMFNAPNTVIWNARSTTIQLNNTSDFSVRNSQFLADGTLDTTKAQPQNAGFGAVSGSNGGRSIQGQIRFTF